MSSKAKNKILLVAKELFYKFGYSKVTIEEIARNLSISKKTIYQNFSSKYDILIQIVKLFKEEHNLKVNEVINNDSLSFPAKLEGLLTVTGTSLSKINTVFIEDIQRSEPEVWESLKSFKREAAFIRFRKLIIEGKEQGYIDANVNKGILISLYASAIQGMFDMNVIHQLPVSVRTEIPVRPEDVFKSVIAILFKGILTERGRKELIAK